MAASSPAVRRRAPARSRTWTRLGIAGLVVLAAVVVVPLFFAGSKGKLAAGTRIGGLDVGGLAPSEAKALLQARAKRLETVPVAFTAGGKRFRVSARTVGVTADWGAAVDEAMRDGGGFGIVRGYRRIGLELFPQDVVAPTHAYDAALDYKLSLIARAVDTPHRDARLVRRGLRVTIAAGSTGLTLDRAAAREGIVAALASFSRLPVALPVRVDPPRVTVASLTAAQRRASIVVSAPVRAKVAGKTLRIPRWRLATILDLKTRRFTGPAADAYFARLAKQVDRTPVDATWAIRNSTVSVVPAKPGLALDVPRAANALLAAASRPTNRVASLPLETAQPDRSTSEAQAMGITGTVGSYETFYGGDPNRIHNVRLVAHLVDDKLIAPGATFSFNGTTGERSAEKGFLEAPVIVNGELQTGLGGGVCQVSTTVFNAAYEAGLPISARTNHALYISHYPLGRDATVNYPDIDLKFLNDTGHWLLLRTWVGSSSLTAVLYGTPVHRRVDSVAQPLRVVAPPPVEKTVDATLKPGQVEVDDPGVPAQTTSVERKVYAPNGSLLSDQTFYSSYRAEAKVVRVGPKAKPKEKAKPKATAPATTSTTSTETAPTTTAETPRLPR
ncbi:MAG TPA: VanW family protein [Gaiellaceae bacterium]|nr:VanW family protein [Gaiellaceae bacterium]